MGGRLLGVLTLLLDLLKGFFVIMIAFSLTQRFEALYGFFCIIGHIFPIWLRFKGGKGVSTMFGVILGTYPFWGLLMAFFYIIVLKCWKISSISSLLSLCSTIIFITIINFNYVNSIFLFLSLVLIIYKHKDNLTRLYKKGEENKICL